MSDPFSTHARRLAGAMKGRPRKFSAVPAGLLALALTLVFAEGAFRALLFVQARSAAPGAGFDLYAMGESSMKGMPFHVPPAYIVSELFSGSIAGRPLRVVDLAFSGNSVYPQAVKTMRALKYRRRDRPGALLIYSGHNEHMTGERPSLAARSFEAFKRHVLIHSLIFSEIVQRAENRYSIHGVRDLDHYEFYLRAVIEAARAAGVTPVIATLASNVSGVEPGGAGNGAALERALRLEMRGDYAGALPLYRGMLDEALTEASPYPSAYPAYRMGRCLMGLGRPSEAARYFLMALENDPEQQRAKPSQNAVVRRLAGEYGIPLVDAEKLLAGRSASGLPGSGQMVDLMHPDMDGYLLLSRAFAGRLAAVYGGRPRTDIRSPADLRLVPEMRAVPDDLAYTDAGMFLLWFSKPGLPIPDRLALAEKDFRAAMKLSNSGLARLGARMAAVSRRNGCVIPAELDAWFRLNRASFGGLRPMSAAELERADAFLRRRERPRS